MSLIAPILKYIETFTVHGFSTRTQNADEFNKDTAKLPGLWQEFHSSDLATAGNIYGVYSDYETDANGFYTVTAGIQSEDEKAELTSVSVLAGNYLVFQNKGPMPEAVIETWKTIWDYFAKENNYRRSFLSDFEIYSATDEIAVYIGVVA